MAQWHLGGTDEPDRVMIPQLDLLIGLPPIAIFAIPGVELAVSLCMLVKLKGQYYSGVDARCGYKKITVSILLVLPLSHLQYFVTVTAKLGPAILWAASACSSEDMKVKGLQACAAMSPWWHMSPMG